MSEKRSKTAMLTEILSREECAKCRICCCFDSYDIWEAPVVSKELSGMICDINPGQEFVHKGESFVMKMQKEENEDLYYCSVLDHSKGCLLGAEKPFDCSIWPLRVMRFEGKRVIALSPVCPVVKTRPVEKVSAVAKKLSDKIFSEADKNPDLVKNYEVGYIILVVEGA